ncbi:MAG: DMT family transporter [Eubacteriales bacterium]|nr:DMT family transporter [Eubacteriales bacterium]
MTNKAAMKSNLLLLLATFIWGTAFVAQSTGMEHVGPFTFGTVRFLLGCVVLLPVIYFRDRAEGKRFTLFGTAEPGERKALVKAGVLCGVILSIASGMQQIGMLYTTVGKAGFLTTLYVVLVPVLGLFLGKRVRHVVWLAVAVALIGAYLLCMTPGGLTVNPGDVCMMICALFFSFHILFIDRYALHVDSLRFSSLQFLVCSIINAVMMCLFETPNIAAIGNAWLSILYTGALSCGVAYTLQVVAQKNIHPVVATLLFAMESVFAVLSGWAILGETLTFREGIGCALVFGAVILAQLPERKKAKQPAE